MMGIMPGRKEIACGQTVVCDTCGAYGRYQVFMTYMALSIFFIPVLKWNRQYLVTMSCCGTTYQLNPDIGLRLSLGENIEILPEDLERIDGTGRQVKIRRCSNCGYTTEEEFEFCPKCGKHF